MLYKLREQLHIVGAQIILVRQKSICTCRQPQRSTSRHVRRSQKQPGGSGRDYMLLARALSLVSTGMTLNIENAERHASQHAAKN